MKVLIVGAGISGSSAARILAEKGHFVTVIDQRDHIGGNCYDYFDRDGICIHKYGTHIFHTDNQQVWNFVSRFTLWYPYQHKVLGLIDGMEVPIPFNLNSIDQIFPKFMAEKLSKKLIDEFGFNIKVPILKLREVGDEDLDFLADYIYEKVFLHYTLKQWGMKPEDLDPSVTGRVPVYVSRDNRYFQNRFQGIPLQGYTIMIQHMLDHRNINVLLNTPFVHEMESEYDRIYYSGPIDEYFKYKFGELPYRSLRFEFLRFESPYFQSNAVINYPCNYEFTRIGEYKYFLNNKSKCTTVSFEYPERFELGKNERYYPVNTLDAISRYSKYIEISKNELKVSFIGRLGAYRYFDMDGAILNCLEMLG
ncbi:UDP-galactopyranose mutase [Sutterella wadsworthensis]|uniref:UDP-galactopyranose mutase n=1 Tax=Sutterella wadsworthensis TaxID=40545 RepID=UPI0013F686CF|nr:UDP-galactopyranose mutase [Sutterella wadsworthensis]